MIPGISRNCRRTSTMIAWAVVPTALMELLHDPDRAKAQRVMSAMLQMGKIEIEPLRRAYEGEEQPAATT